MFVMLQNALLNIVIIPLKDVILSALRAHTETARVQKMCEKKIAVDGMLRTDAASCASLVDLRAGVLAASALRRVALQHERFTDWSIAGDSAREYTARTAHIAERYADILEQRIHALGVFGRASSGEAAKLAPKRRSVAAARHSLEKVQHRAHKTLRRLEVSLQQRVAGAHLHLVARQSSRLTPEQWAHVVLATAPSEAVQLHSQQLKARRQLAQSRFGSWPRRLAAAKLLGWRKPYSPAAAHTIEPRGTLPPTRRPGLSIVACACTVFAVLYVM